MKWIIQENLYVEDNHYKLISFLNKMNIPYIIITVKNNKIICNDKIDNSEPIFICGTYSLNKLSKKLNWNPGCIDENINTGFNFDTYKEHCLNYNCVKIKVKFITDKILPIQFFSRPFEDSKMFNGKVFNSIEFINMLGLINRKYLNEFVIISSIVYDIVSEYRFFIVGGKIITYSQYKMNNIFHANKLVDNRIIEFAESMIKLGIPNNAFVMDICELRNGDLKVVETNTINSSGFYDIEIDKLVMSIEDEFNKF